MLFGGVGFLGHAVRTGKPVEHYDVAKAQRWKREMEQALHPNGTDLEAVADFNELHLDEYILGDVAVEGFSCATAFQRAIVKDIIKELQDLTLDEGERDWDGWSFNDLTYSTTNKMYMQTMAFYNFKWHMTVPVFTTFLRGLTAIHYCRHFDNFFHYNPDVVIMREAEVFFQLMGFCMDFSDAQFIGLGIAYGKLFLRLVHKDTRDDRDVDFIKQARHYGDLFVARYCKGCLFHFVQSVRRVSVHVDVDDVKRREFTHLALQWQKAPSTGTPAVMSADQVVAKIESQFPAIRKWIKWWKKRAHLIIEGNMALVKPQEIMESKPPTDNNLEAFHSTWYHVIPRTHMPLFLGVALSYHFAENCRAHAEGIAAGDRKANRQRGSQHDRKRLPKALKADEWVQRPPENARSLRTR